MFFVKELNKAFETIKVYIQKIDLKKWSQDIGGSSADAVHASLYFVLSFGAGFLIKKYFRSLLATFFMAIILIKLFEYNALITIDWVAIKKLTGISSTAHFNAMINILITWIKKNIFLFGAAVIGFLLGYRLG